MMKRVLVAVAALAISAAGVAAQTAIKKAPIKPTSAAKPQQMFDSYCAVCHGTDGTGHGPAAMALTKAPADLTKISARNGGTWPAVRVQRYIAGADEVPAHGTRDMPMWGDLFRSLNRDTDQLRVAALADYLKAMQK
jgi:mono/diheme cytochrome c family protein